MSANNSIIDTNGTNKLQTGEIFNSTINPDLPFVNYRTRDNFANISLNDNIKSSDETVTKSLTTNNYNKSNVTENNTDLFSHKSFIFNENWSSVVNIQARILDFTKGTVTCECLIDSDELVFENRDFPAILFKHITLKIKSFILISIKTKVGSMKIDVFKGDDFVNKSLFIDSNMDNDSMWNEIIQSDFIKNFSYNPK